MNARITFDRDRTWKYEVLSGLQAVSRKLSFRCVISRKEPAIIRLTTRSSHYRAALVDWIVQYTLIYTDTENWYYYKINKKYPFCKFMLHTTTDL